MRRTITALLTAVALAGLAAATPALATTQVPPPVGGFKLCLKSDHGLCVKSNGVQAQATVVSSGYSTWNLAQSGGHDVFTNQSGNCLRVRNDLTVELSTSCSGDTASEWDQGSSGGVPVFSNVAHGGHLSVNSDSGGAGVRDGAAWLITNLTS